MTLPCPDCAGSGRSYSVRGAHDPSPRFTGACEACDGSGDQACSSLRCAGVAEGRNEDGEPLCVVCLHNFVDDSQILMQGAA
jgi:DnaJ-class molecular chaperone